MRDGKDALIVNWFAIEILNAAGKVTYHNSFIIDLPVGPENVAELAACGRARWKIENETFNVLKTKGYNLEHSFGHGKQHLASGCEPKLCAQATRCCERWRALSLAAARFCLSLSQ